MNADGARVAVTRDEGVRGPLSCALRDRGLVPVRCSVIQHEAPEDPGPLRRAARELAAFDWLVVASHRAVQALSAAREGAPLPTGLRTAAVGTSTAAAVCAAGSADPIVAPEAGAEPLVRLLLDADRWPGRRVLLPSAAEGRTVLADALRAAGAEVIEVVAYRTLARPALDVARAWAAAAPDAVVVASPSAVRALVAGIGAPALRALRAVVAIGPTTAAALAEIGVETGVPVGTDFESAATLVRVLLEHDATHPAIRAARAAGEE